VISCRIHLIKPEPAIYAYLLEKHGLEGADTIFIDDTIVNLEAAARFEIRTIHFENAAQCEHRLRAWGCL
jgi:putative hydrolase of the HAD superfamily